jgi:1,4-dihydroxy-2-naphthoyl-CoA hydrolase
MHSFKTVIRLQHTDAAGVVFFARYFELAHLAYEDLLDAIGQSLPPELGREALILPIVHAESDYRAALRLGDVLHIDVAVEAVRSRSFSLAYVFRTTDGIEAATLRTVHVAVDTTTGTSAALPEALADALRGAAG